MKNKLNIFSFFAGAGFLDLGFELSGHYNVVYVNEFHQAFNDIYQFSRARMGIPMPQYGHHVENILDLLKRKNLTSLKRIIEESRKESITGFIGGPPCPDFSVAGKNKGKDGDNGKLSGTYISLICRTKPDFFLFENVKGLYRTTKHREFFDALKRRLKRNGYIMTEELINAIEFGAPQNRERIILIGVHRDLLKTLNIQYAKGSLNTFDWNSHKLYGKEILSSIPWPSVSPYVENNVTQMPAGIIKELTVQYWWDKNDVIHHPNANMFFKPKAGLVRFVTIDEGDDKKKCYKRLHRWRYSPTAAYGNNEVHIHPYKPRRISVSEALAIQSLPKEYCLPSTVSLSDAFKTIGNGVPFLAAKGIANSIYDFLIQTKK